MRVLVARPRDQAEATAQRLGAIGHEPFVAPLLAITPTPDPPPTGPFDAVVITSANGVPALARLVGGTRSTPVFAVGERTAALLRQARFTDVREAEGNAASLAALVRRQLAPGVRLIHVAGRDRKPEPSLSLGRAGFDIEPWVAYEAVAAKTMPQELVEALANDRLDAALHYSARSADCFIRLAAEAGAGGHLSGLAHLCLSAEVAAAFGQRPRERLIVAQRPDEASLFEALALCEPPRPT